MSGIFGFWRLDGRPVERETLERMSNVLAHRGPDGSSMWQGGPVGLGHRMFRATPESIAEHQPLVAPGGDLVLTADVRLDNRDELITSLKPHGRAHEVTDAELILRAYERWGLGCAEKLLGDFAFVLWDAREQALVCVRDHFGIKPFYYYHAPGRLFAFASEIKALLTLEDIPDEIDEMEIARHLVLPVNDDLTSTFYQFVKRPLPGSTLTVSSRGLEERRYWELDGTRSLTLSSDGEYAEAFRELFVRAVKARLRSNAPVATMLSGGLDSSSITCIAASHFKDVGGPRTHTLSAIYPRVPQADERHFIREVLERHDVVPHFFEADSVSPVAEIEAMNWHADGANSGGNAYVQWKLYHIAGEQGARVVLDGFDGDTTVSHGAGYLQELALSGRWLRLAMKTMPLAYRLGEPPVATYWEWVRRFGLRPALRDTRLKSLSHRSKKRSSMSDSAMSRSFWRYVVNQDFADRLSDHIVPYPPLARTEREEHHRSLSRQILLHGVTATEAFGPAAGVEVRFPFFDARLAEFTLSLPADQKLRRGWSRYIIRRAMDGILPPRIQWRPAKTSVAPGFRYALRSHDRERHDMLVDEAQPSLERFVDSTKLRSLHERFMAGRVSEAEELAYWRALSLALWLTPCGTGRVHDGQDLARSPRILRHSLTVKKGGTI